MKTENENIAEFMGVQVYQSYEAMQAVPLEELKEWRTTDQLEYDSSWNELMPVVEKINKMTPDIFNYNAQARTEFRLVKNEIQMLSIMTPIEIVYNSVVEFAKWHNSQNPKP